MAMKDNRSLSLSLFLHREIGIEMPAICLISLRGHNRFNKYPMGKKTAGLIIFISTPPLPSHLPLLPLHSWLFGFICGKSIKFIGRFETRATGQLFRFIRANGRAGIPGNGLPASGFYPQSITQTSDATLAAALITGDVHRGYCYRRR